MQHNVSILYSGSFWYLNIHYIFFVLLQISKPFVSSHVGLFTVYILVLSGIIMTQQGMLRTLIWNTCHSSLLLFVCCINVITSWRVIWYIQSNSSGLHCWYPCLYSIRRHCLIGTGIPIINLRWSLDHLMFIMGIPIPSFLFLMHHQNTAHSQWFIFISKDHFVILG